MAASHGFREAHSKGRSSARIFERTAENGVFRVGRTVEKGTTVSLLTAKSLSYAHDVGARTGFGEF